MGFERSKGAVLFEALLMVVLWGALVGGTQMAVMSFWQKRLRALDRERLVYDGIAP